MDESGCLFCRNLKYVSFWILNKTFKMLSKHIFDMLGLLALLPALWVLFPVNLGTDRDASLLLWLKACIKGGETAFPQFNLRFAHIFQPRPIKTANLRKQSIHLIWIYKTWNLWGFAPIFLTLLIHTVMNFGLQTLSKLGLHKWGYFEWW